MTRGLKEHKASRSAPPRRLQRVFEVPILAWQRLESEPLDAAYYVLLEGGQEQVLWINQRAKGEPKIARYVTAMRLLPTLTPPLVCADTTLTRLEYPYLITGFLPTPTVADAWPHLDGAGRARAAAAWGRALRLIHRIRFDLAGDLAQPEARGQRLVPYLGTLWARFLGHAVKDNMVDTPKLVSRLEQGKALLADAPIALLHGLPKSGSFLYTSKTGDVVAVLDFGDAWRGDPMCDLAAIWYTELTEKGVQEAFLEGYGALSKWELERLEFYRLHHALARYALALTHDRHQIAKSRLHLMRTLEAAR